MKQGSKSILLLIVLGMMSCQSGQKKEIVYKEYTSPDKSYVVSIPERIPANKCVADFMSFVKDDNFIIIQRVPFDYLSNDVTKIDEKSGKFSFSQIEVSDTSILYQASKGLITAYKYYLIKKLPTANYMISVSSITGSKIGIKEMGSSIYASLKPFQSGDVETRNVNVSLKADKTYSNHYYSIKYPKEWKAIENIDEMTDVYIGSQQQDFGFTVVRIETDYSLSEAHAEANENIRQLGFSIINDYQVTLAGVKCYKTLQEGTIQNKRIKHLSYIFKKGEMFYSIKFGNLSNNEQASLADEIMTSFCFK